MPMKDFLLWLILSHMGRLMFGSILLTLGALIYNYTDNLASFYVGLTVFASQCIVMFIIMIIEIFNGE